MMPSFTTHKDPPGGELPPHITEILRPIWQHVLDRPIGLEDNFFDVGGNPSLAVRLFGKISEVSNRDLPPQLIYLAPTISLQAALLSLPVPPSIPPLVLLKPGTTPQALFMTHGLGASIMELFHVVRYMRSDFPIYGMQARGIDGLDKPFDCVEDLAVSYLDAIKKLQPFGPYYLAGFSFGGLVALEMACRLSEAGEEVAFLALLDSYPNPRWLSLLQRARLITLRGKRRILRIIKSHTLGPSRHSALEISVAGRWTEYKEAMTLAWSNYRPRSYAGKVTFVKAEDSSRFPDNPRAVWTNLVKEFELETVPGDHVDMMAKQALALADLLSRRIAEAGGH